MGKIIVYGILIEVLLLISLLVLPVQMFVLSTITLIAGVRRMESELNDAASQRVSNGITTS